MLRATARPLRSVLFAAGDDPDGLRAASASGADAVIVDVEEPRAPFTDADREAVRARVAEALSEVPTGAGAPLWLARVQPISSGQTMRDLRAVWCEALAGVVLPKIDGPADVHGLDALELEAQRAQPPAV